MGACMGNQATVTTKKIVNAPNVQDLAGSGEHDWARDGTLCEREGGSPAECFLDPLKRVAYIFELRESVNDMKESYKLAATQLRAELQMEKDDELGMFGSLILETAVGQVTGLLRGSIARLRARTPALAHLSDTAVDGWTKPAFDMGKTSARKAAKKVHNYDDNTDKVAKVSFVDSLTTSAETGFNTFRDRASADSNDAKILVVWEALRNAPKDIETFKGLLAEKLGRFEESGVRDVGRRDAYDETSSPSAQVARDTRVVWVVQPQGGRKLYYQSQDGDVDSQVFSEGDPGTSWLGSGPKDFGPRHARGGAKVGKPVPEEFIDVALEAGMQQWGEVPTINPFPAPPHPYWLDDAIPPSPTPTVSKDIPVPLYAPSLIGQTP